MTAKICFKLGKYLNNSSYKESIFAVIVSVPEIQTIDLIILFSNHLGIKKENITIDEMKREVEKACEEADEYPDEIKKLILDNYLEGNPEDRTE
jgi:hypothetical protein